MQQQSTKRRVLTKRRLKEWERNPFLFGFWERLFHFERIEFLFSLAIPLLKLTGIYRKGYLNALNIRMHLVNLNFKTLPSAFDGYRILFISDLHADKNQEIIRNLSQQLKYLEFDLILLGGDYRFKIKGIFDKALHSVKELFQNLKSKDGIWAVLGNHDPWEIIDSMEEMGIKMLINESVSITKDGQQLWLLGLDDAHYFESDDFEQANKNIPEKAFRVVLCHSNDALLHIPPAKCDLFLSGHTHGGQICFPLIGPLLVHSRMPRYMSKDLWEYKGIQGITTAGVGTSGLPMRFNCPGEFVIITLKRQTNS